MKSIRIVFLVLVLIAPCVQAQFSFDTKKLMEDFSLQLFEANAQGYMSPLVMVANVGANDGFFNSASIPKKNKLHLNFSVRSMMSWVREDQKTYTGRIPLEAKPTDDGQLLLFKQLLIGAAQAGELKTSIRSSTVFGSSGEMFHIPKAYIQRTMPFIPDSILRSLPDSLPLTPGVDRSFLFAAVPQLSIGTFMNSQMLLRFIPPIEFDSAVGDFSFFGIAIRHGFTNWIKNCPIDAAVQISYQYSTIDNYVGATQAHLQAQTTMWSVNIHASKRFGYVEPYLGLSFEHLGSKGSYTFTLPASVVAQIGYDITPQKAHISLEDNAVKFTVGVTGHLGPMEAYVGIGLSKQFLLGAGIGGNIPIIGD